MFEKLTEVQQRYHELGSMLADPSVTSDPNQLRTLSKEHAQLSEVVTTFEAFTEAKAELVENQALLREAQDEDFRALAKEEVERLEHEIDRLEAQLLVLMLPKDPLDEKNIYIEIRAAAGGDEAAIFVGDLFRMYSRYAERSGWRVVPMDQSHSEKGGYKQIVARIEGHAVYSRLKFESGTHRVQRVPDTESQGRIHTSTVTVAILPEVDEEVEVEIHPGDLRIDTYRSSGAGGQHVNTTDSAVRITHLPTGIVVQCQNERSQIKNRDTAMKQLKAALYTAELERQRSAVAADRRSQVGTGDRSERIRTYNYPQSRITDHRIGLTVHKLEQVINGDIEHVIDPLATHYQAESLKSLGAAPSPP